MSWVISSKNNWHRLVVIIMMNTWDRCQAVAAHHHHHHHHLEEHHDYCSSAQWKQTYNEHYVSQLSNNESQTETESVSPSQSETSFNCSRNLAAAAVATTTSKTMLTCNCLLPKFVDLSLLEFTTNSKKHYGKIIVSFNNFQYIIKYKLLKPSQNCC